MGRLLPGFELRRCVRGWYRRTFYSKGPWWFGLRVGASELHFALRGEKPTVEQLTEHRKAEAEVVLKVWHEGY